MINGRSLICFNKVSGVTRKRGRSGIYLATCVLMSEPGYAIMYKRTLDLYL